MENNKEFIPVAAIALGIPFVTIPFSNVLSFHRLVLLAIGLGILFGAIMRVQLLLGKKIDELKDITEGKDINK